MLPLLACMHSVRVIDNFTHCHVLLLVYLTGNVTTFPLCKLIGNMCKHRQHTTAG